MLQTLEQFSLSANITEHIQKIKMVRRIKKTQTKNTHSHHLVEKVYHDRKTQRVSVLCSVFQGQLYIAFFFHVLRIVFLLLCAICFVIECRITLVIQYRLLHVGAMIFLKHSHCHYKEYIGV